MPPMRTSDLDDLSQLLPYLRQLLTCCACAGLLDKAMISLSCGHCYCYECQFREPLLKIHCRQCRERTGLVTERQLQLVVNCYRSMCHILGEELRKDPYAFSKHDKEHVNGEDDEDLKMSVPIPARLAVQAHRKNDSSGLEGVNGRTEPPVTNGVSVDPIAEIIREVEKGTKVSRAIFVIKPPSKYMNSRAATQTPRKDSVMGISVSTSSASKKALSPFKEESKECVAPGLHTETGGEDIGMEVNGKCGEVDVDPADGDMVSEIQPKSRKRIRRKSSQVEKRRKQVKTESDSSTLGNSLEDSNVATRTEADKPQVTKISLSALKLNSRQRQLNARKRKKALSILSKSKSENSREERAAEETCTNKNSVSPRSRNGFSPPESEGQDILSEIYIKDLNISVDSLDENFLSVTEEKVALLPHEQLSYKLSQAVKDSPPASDSSKRVPRDHWKSLTRTRTLSPFCSRIVVKRLGEDIAQNILLMINAAKVKRKMRQKAKLAATMGGGDKSHLPTTPSTHVSRQRPRNRSQRHSVPTPTVPVPVIAETNTNDIIPEHITILSADGKDTISDADINWTEFSNFFESNDDSSIAELAKLDCYNPPSPLEQQEKKLEQQIQHERVKDNVHVKDHLHGEHLMQQQMEQKQHRELKQHREQQKQHPQPLPSLPLPLPLPPMLPQLSSRELDPLFRDFEPPGMMHPPPHSHHHRHHHHHPHHPRHCLPPPHPHRPHDPMGRSSRMPHPHSRPLPPSHPHHHQMMNFPPMMGPPNLPPPPEYYPPPMTPGRIRPDVSSGFSSPITPIRGNFSSEPSLDGVFHQGSPNQHPRSGNFPFPNSRGSFSPVRGSFPPRPTPPTTPVMVQQPLKKKKKNAADDPLSGMVQKMKMKPPSAAPKANLAAPVTPTKKRRSPGYSETGWRCRCGTNKIMFPDKVCAKGKCPCYAKGTACKNCLCRFCHNPFGARESTKSVLPTSTALASTTSPDKSFDSSTAGDEAEVQNEGSELKPCEVMPKIPDVKEDLDSSV